jgi:predicted nucleotidyltransferase
MNRLDAEALAKAAAIWVNHQGDLRSLVMVGSFARGTPKPESDLDFVIVADAPEAYGENIGWVQELLLETEGFKLVNVFTKAASGIWWIYIELCRDGRKIEAEIKLVSAEWIDMSSAESEFQQSVRDAFRILVDKSGELENIVTLIRQKPFGIGNS